MSEDATMAFETFDLEHVLREVGDESVAAELAAIVKADMTSYADALEAAAAGGQTARVRELAHAIKGAAGNVSATSVCDLGVSDYLLKPPRAERLVEKVQRVLKVLPKTRAAEDDGTGVRMPQASLRPFVRSEGGMSALALTVPDLPEIVSMATSQVLGMIFDADVSTTNAEAEVDGSPSAATNVAIAERFLVTIGVHVTAEIAGRVIPKMFGEDYTASGVDDCSAVATELVNLVAGRLNAILSERAVHSAEAGPLSTPLPSDSDRSLISVAIPDVGDLLLDLTVLDRLAVSPDDDAPAIATLEAVGAKGTA